MRFDFVGFCGIGEFSGLMLLCCAPHLLALHISIYVMMYNYTTYAIEKKIFDESAKCASRT
jgi:hypothetical protein